jgi:inner membrane protein
LRAESPTTTMHAVASLAHVIVGMAGGRALDRSPRPSLRAILALVALSLLADLDVLAFRLGIPYAAPFGHRGATHSILFAIAVGAAAAVLLARERRWPLARLTVVACAVALSHPLLDAMTDGGLGVALLWPFSNARFFAPWRPIPVAPIGARMLSGRGLHVLWIEAIGCLPLLAWALWPRSSPGNGTMGR